MDKLQYRYATSSALRDWMVSEFPPILQKKAAFSRSEEQLEGVRGWRGSFYLLAAGGGDKPSKHFWFYIVGKVEVVKNLEVVVQKYCSHLSPLATPLIIERRH